MRKVSVSVLVLAALSALTLFGFASDAHAQAAFYPKRVPLQFQRLNTAADNPFASLVPPQPYVTAISNGNHNNNAGSSAAALQDTSIAIFVGDHWLKSVPSYRTQPALATALLADSAWFGTLSITANSGTIDSVMFFRDFSADGKTWTGCDSVIFHVISAQSIPATANVASDSSFVILSTQSAPTGTVATAGALTFTANPWFSTSGVTGQALLGVNYIRFRFHMTPGDYAAAGAARGLSAEWLYPSVDANPNQPRLLNP